MSEPHRDKPSDPKPSERPEFKEAEYQVRWLAEHEGKKLEDYEKWVARRNEVYLATTSSRVTVFEEWLSRSLDLATMTETESRARQDLDAAAQSEGLLRKKLTLIGGTEPLSWPIISLNGTRVSLRDTWGYLVVVNMSKLRDRAGHLPLGYAGAQATCRRLARRLDILGGTLHAMFDRVYGRLDIGRLNRQTEREQVTSAMTDLTKALTAWQDLVRTESIPEPEKLWLAADNVYKKVRVALDSLFLAKQATINGHTPDEAAVNDLYALITAAGAEVGTQFRSRAAIGDWRGIFDLFCEESRQDSFMEKISSNDAYILDYNLGELIQNELQRVYITAAERGDAQAQALITKLMHTETIPKYYDGFRVWIRDCEANLVNEIYLTNGRAAVNKLSQALTDYLNAFEAGYANSGLLQASEAGMLLQRLSKAVRIALLKAIE